ncbi:uncharacterized protein [Saccopteryx leptura]|uniref:uncharacterized protein n=1 Tax=Saccopteryx leptura TaxID=249018 RepID=UPI00339BF9C7
MKERCLEETRDLLASLQVLGYRVSAKEAQLCTSEVSYLGCRVKEGQRTLSYEHIKAILWVPTPTTKRQVREFLGAVGYCRLWILSFAKLAKPLYACTGMSQFLNWTETEQKAFEDLERTLASVPALALPDISEPFLLVIHETGESQKGF